MMNAFILIVTQVKTSVYLQVWDVQTNMGKAKFPRGGSTLMFKGGTKFKKFQKGGLKKSKGVIVTFFWGLKPFQLRDKKFSK